MTSNTREQRLREDLSALETLRESSNIFTFQTQGEPPDFYAITFRGTGLQRDAATGVVSEQAVHQCQIRLTFSYPDHAPEIRWETPIFHPNISFGGFIRLPDLGMTWTPQMTLDAVCERLWDTARLAFVNEQRITNHSAHRWLSGECPYTLPIDPRPLQDRLAAAPSNVIRYERRGGTKLFSSPAEREPEILYIGEETPSSPMTGDPDRAFDERDDILYIGDE